MKTLISAQRVLAVIGASLFLASQLTASVVYNNPTGTVGNQTGGPWILGMDFQVNTPGYVTAVGAFDNGTNGFGSISLQVSIYDVSSGTQVPGTAVSFTGNQGTLIDSSRFLTLATPVLLAPGTYSIVAANYGATTEVNYNSGYTSSTSLTFDTVGGALTMLDGRYDAGSSLAFPTITGFGPPTWPNPVFAAGTFDFLIVPEPSTISLAVLGLATGALLAFRRRN